MKQQLRTEKKINSDNVNSPIGVLAGSGVLPHSIVEACKASGREVFVIAFEGSADLPLDNIQHSWVNIGSVGKAIKILRDNKIEEIILAGRVGRPELKDLDLDFSGVKLLSKIVRQRAQGDNKLFAVIIKYLEKAGFIVRGVDEVAGDLLAPKGTITSRSPDKREKEDIKVGVNAAKLLGQADIGQAVVVQRGVVIGVEAVEGTDNLIKRCSDILAGDANATLVKVKKPEQDVRIDLPTIGVNTVENAYNNGLRGIAVEAGGTLILEQAKVIKKANELGMFIYGVEI